MDRIQSSYAYFRYHFLIITIMKKIYIYLLCLISVLSVSSCLDKYTEELMLNVPVYMDYATLRSSVKQAAPRALMNPGKICFKDQYLLIVEFREGFHVVDVSNPANPNNKVFVEIPGCVDIAIKDNTVYADSYVDLIVIDLSDINHPKEKTRLKDIFPYTVPAAENEKFPYSKVDVEKGVVVAWEEKREKRDLERGYYLQYPINPSYRYDTRSYLNSASSGGVISGGSTQSFGKSGSMARFGLYDKYLYTLNSYMLLIFDVENANDPFKTGTQYVNSGYETIFIYDDHIFFGTSSGMYVYSLSTPNTPVYVQNFWHITSCDPVVVQDGYAYVTLRGGTDCRNNSVNRLDILRCSDDYKQLSLVNSYDMTQPYGLGIDNNVLFVCDGNAGLKVYDVTVKDKINLLTSFPNIKTYDVIPVDGYLFMIGDDGFYLYDYSDLKNIRLIGNIPVVKK